MITNLILITFLLTISVAFARYLSSQFRETQFKIYRNLIIAHVLLSITYYLYAIANPSDSWAYYDKVVLNFRGDSWMDYYGISTVFIEFLGYPFIKFLGFNYEGMMIVFSWFGLLGFFFLYVFFAEQIKFSHRLMGYNLMYISLFLPNLHFWSASFGKGSIILLGIGLFFFSLNRIDRRLPALVIGSLIVYHVRPHILFIMLVGTAVGLAFSSRGASWLSRIVVTAFVVFAFNYIYQDVLSLVGLDEEELFQESSQLTRRVRGLTDAASGVDITGYSFPMKMFTFLFRPLFIDAPGILGIIVSFENLFYLFITFKLLRPAFFSFLFRSDAVVKAAFISFVGIAAALAQISANLGLAMRQKSQIMPLLLFVVLKFMDSQTASQPKRMPTPKMTRQKVL